MITQSGPYGDIRRSGGSTRVALNTGSRRSPSTLTTLRVVIRHAGGVNELQSLWEVHLAEHFPPSLEKGRDYAGVDLVLVDADIAGLVQAAVSGSRTGAAERRLLHELGEDVARVLPTLPEDARGYFERLRRIAVLGAEDQL